MDMSVLEKIVLGNRVLDYIIAVVAFIVSLLIVKLIVTVIVRRIKKFAEKTATTIDDLLADILEKVILPALYITSFYVSFTMLSFPETAEKIVKMIEMAVIAFFAAKSAVMLLSYAITAYLAKKDGDPTLVKSLECLLRVARFIVWALAAVILFDNMGFKISALIAGLGIGGVAVAIAAQALLKDFFSYFSIVFDRPFKIGDFIVIGDFMGTVEHIGIKTTRIRSLGGEQVIFSNTDLTDSRVRNYKLMEKRRVLFRIGVTYETTNDKLKEIPGIIEKVIRRAGGTEFDRAHFFSYGDFSLIFEVVYFVLSSDYNRYMDVQQSINFSIKEEFEKLGIEFAYPTQTLYVNKQT